MTQATDLQIIRAGVEIGVPAARVHRALTEELDRWLADSAAVDLDAGAYDFWGPHVFEAPDRDAGRHTLLEHEADRMLRFAWHVRGADTEVTIELTPAGGGTRVDVTHAGVPQRAPAAASVDDVWKVTLENLRRWCERGEAPVRVDFGRDPVGEARTQIDMDAPVEAVFDTLTKPELVREWCGGDAQIDPASAVATRSDGRAAARWRSSTSRRRTGSRTPGRIHPSPRALSRGSSRAPGEDAGHDHALRLRRPRRRRLRGRLDVVPGHDPKPGRGPRLSHLALAAGANWSSRRTRAGTSTGIPTARPPTASTTASTIESAAAAAWTGL